MAEKKKARRRDPLELVSVDITPPELAPRTAAEKLDRSLTESETRPSPAELSKLPWLSQDRPYRAGYHLSTTGLREHASHPELEICNVPGVMLHAAYGTLNALADYALNSGASLSHGEVLVLSEDPLAVVGFRKIGAAASRAEDGLDRLRVLFLR